MIAGKKIIVGISGGIAAYKSPMLVRELIKRSAKVRVVASENALKFVSIVSLQTVSDHPVYYDMFLPYLESTTEHVSLASWADIMVVAPATANTIGKMANGICDNALTTTFMAFKGEIFVCPAMNTAMYENSALQRNLDILKSRGVHIIDADDGFLACGVEGKGRMADIETIVKCIEYSYQSISDFSGKIVTLTAGGTREKIDSVRFISNNSSGKMGYEIAKEFLRRGAKVNLIMGHNSVSIKEADNLNIMNVSSAEEMYNATMSVAEKSDIIVCSAAVADYRPKNTYNGKIKKKEDNLTIELEPTKDILLEVCKRKNNHQVVVGFALETDNELSNAQEKLHRKNFDFIVLNSLRDEGAGFECSTNKVTIIDKFGHITPLPLKSKEEVAIDIVNTVKGFV